MKRYSFYVSKSVNKAFQAKKFGRQGSKQLREVLDKGLDKAQLIRYIRDTKMNDRNDGEKEIKLLTLTEFQSKEIDDLCDSLKQMGLNANRSTIIEYLLTILEPKGQKELKKRVYYVPKDILELLDVAIKKQTTTISSNGTFVRRKDEIVRFIDEGLYTPIESLKEYEQYNQWSDDKHQLQLVLDIETDKFIGEQSIRLFGNDESKNRIKVLCDVFRQYVKYTEEDTISKIREVKLLMHKVIERSVDLVGWNESKELVNEVMEVYEFEGGQTMYPTGKEELIYPGDESEVEYKTDKTDKK
ncbi:hypothetical protein QK289_13110 [Exiguobacterium antarcticum]|uniref:Uncharacterized protein n=1 Tax=Exiguobacterium antarcticum TaxID=132920 RepID=A0ABT6R6N7_9BACL|nr:hypothetical protein [Exiguobacterium antarcticum]MDI3235949.1 hypothetical protein [Exiguobacterium antarcticum]